MKVAIAGYGIEGKASFDYWRALGAELTIVDERDIDSGLPDGVSTHFGPDAFAQLDGFDLVVRTASLRPDKIRTDGKVWSATNEFFAKCPAPIIGVTGTKGKGTTCSLIASILRRAGYTVHLVGNIGTPALETLANITSEDIVVYELSSFQLWDVEYSPHVAVVLPIEPDHLDIHASFDEYITAKSNIARYQTEADEIVFYSSNEWSRQIADASRASLRSEYPFETDGVLDALVLPGPHNRDNACAAIAATRGYVTDEAVIRQGLAAFTGLPHRLKFVKTIDGVRFYDDSISTTPGSAIAALNSFAEPKIIILGGSDKGATYDAVIAACKQTGSRVIVVGQTGKTIRALCEQAGVEVYNGGPSMDAVVATAQGIARDGDVVILSPASASFDMFKNYADRGDQFIAALDA